MKWVGLMLIFIGCTAIGFIMDYKKRLKLKEVENLIFSFEVLKSEIDYGLTPMEEACVSVAASALPQVGQVFKEFAEGIAARETIDLNQLWHRTLENQQSKLHLDGECYEVIEQFGSAAGYLDKEMQKKNIQMVLDKLRHLYQNQQAHYEKTSRLNTTMGMLFGICIIIFLV